MVRGMDTFRKYFEGFEDQYVLIGGAACDILFTDKASQFRATRDLDMVLIVEALTVEFGERIWEFIKDGKYRNKASNMGKPQFYRFDKPEAEEYPKMIELFSKTNFTLKEANNITPIHVDDAVSSLSAILLNDEYYQTLLMGRICVNGLSVLRPEYLLLFKAKAYMDLKGRKESGENIDLRDIKKHKNDILRIVAEFLLDSPKELPKMVQSDMELFLEGLDADPFDCNILKKYGLSNEAVKNKLRDVYTA